MHVPTSSRRAGTARTAVAALIAAAGCWGVGTVVSKQVVDVVAPLTLLPVQLAVSCALLLVVALARREPLTWTPSVRRLAALGVLNPGIAYALGLIGLMTITASMSVLLWALEPVVILLLATLVLHERIPPALAVTVAVAISGALLVVYQPGAGGDAIGITLTLVSIGFCALALLYSAAVHHCGATSATPLPGPVVASGDAEPDLPVGGSRTRSLRGVDAAGETADDLVRAVLDRTRLPANAVDGRR